MEKAAIKSSIEIEQFRRLAARAVEIFVQNMKKEVDYNDAPEEFRGTYRIYMAPIPFHLIPSLTFPTAF